MSTRRDTIMEDFLAGGPLSTVDVIDCHAHMGPALYMQVPDADPDGMVGVLDQLGVSMACVSHSVAMVSDWRLGNDLLIQAREAHPTRLFGYAFFNPRYPDDMPQELQRCEEAGLRGLKVHPDFHNMPADSPLYEPVFQKAHDERRLILCHYGAGPSPRSGSNVYARVVEKYPDAVYVMAHSLPSTSAVDTARELFGSRSNVYFCLANAFELGVIEYAAATLGSERLLYGSDGCWGAMAPRLGMVCCTDLPVKDKRLILGGTMRRLIDECP